MSLLLISIPFMLLGVAIAVVPLIWGMAHQREHDLLESEGPALHPFASLARAEVQSAEEVLERRIEALEEALRATTGHALVSERSATLSA